MSLADRMRKQDQCLQELTTKLHDLGREFAEEIQRLGLPLVPMMDATGNGRTWRREDGSTGVTIECRPMEIHAFILPVPANDFRYFGRLLGIAYLVITPDGEILFTEFNAKNHTEYVMSHGSSIREDALVFCEARSYPEASSWKELRAEGQSHRLVKLAEKAQAHGLASVLEPIELRMLSVCNDANRR